ncbi:MAG TPA: tRNA uridine-5-carboxymethylaminomethyl(34) synthesis GTPase MnmE [Candidatus Eisenbacteria bacterium]|jgi:tRNA modification GTPase
MRPLEDTIAAIATATGAAGLAVVRVSGPRAVATADAVFRGAHPLADAEANTLHHGWAVWPEPEEHERAPRRLDEVVVALFRGPRSYTREDVVEISCHGGRMPAERVLAALLRAGARLARPGEFTLRAFLNGRIDLAQAEAVADLIHAETAAAHELALSQLAGDLSRRLEDVTERVTESLAEVEARVDFAEDVGGVEVPPHVLAAIAEVEQALEAMLAGAAYARSVREGMRVPIVGRPNVGKSSLFNALLGEERAIVTDVPGTTRDRVSEAVEVAGVRVTLSDTAGLRESGERVEAIGIARALASLEQCPLVLWVVDGSAALAPEDRWIAERLRGKRVLVALNKRDLPARTGAADVAALLDGEPWRMVAVSAARGEGLEELRSSLADLLGAGERHGGHAVSLGNLRHAEALARAREALARARAAGEGGAPGEIVALELREGLGAIGEVTGRTVGEDLLDRIFSRFCIGK